MTRKADKTIPWLTGNTKQAAKKLKKERTTKQKKLDEIMGQMGHNRSGRYD